VIVKVGYALPTRRIKIVEAGHPIPDERGVRAAQECGRILERCAAEDLVICLLSGGGSALLSAPMDSISLDDVRSATQLLLNCGARIQEINAIRKHISSLTGGRMARSSSPARLASLILSDVIGDRLDSIASGPTAPDPTTFIECLEIIERYGLRTQMPAAVLRVFERGANGAIDETPKPSDPLFANVQNVIVGNNRMALNAARQKAEALGYHTLLLSSSLEGESAQAALFHAAVAKEILYTGTPVPTPACLMSGGETTVTVRGDGKGGRNQEFALAAALALAGCERVVILSGGTDGTDGPTDAAGAIVDGTTVPRAKICGLDPTGALQRNDSYTFLQAMDDLLVSGPTFTNVMDIHLVLVG